MQETTYAQVEYGEAYWLPGDPNRYYKIMDNNEVDEEALNTIVLVKR